MSTAETFHALHQRGAPLILYNIWDAGSARAVAQAGAPAIATGSWSVADSQGHPDGQVLPFDDLLRTVARIVAAVDLPVSVDFEGGYARSSAQLADNFARLLNLGVVGINFEDGLFDRAGLRETAAQAERIAGLREVAEATGVSAFINARTDVFLQVEAAHHPDRMADALTRAEAYVRAGASGVFLPGLGDPDLIARACAHLDAPVNVMVGAGAGPETDPAALAGLGVARISYGPTPYRAVIAGLQRATEAVYAPGCAPAPSTAPSGTPASARA